MARFIVFTKLSPEGRKQLLKDPGSLPNLSEELSGVDAKIIELYPAPSAEPAAARAY